MKQERKESLLHPYSFQNIETMLTQNDQSDRNRVMLDIFGNMMHENKNNFSKHVYLHEETKDPRLKPLLYTLGVISNNLKEFEDPAKLLKTFLNDSEDKEVNLILGTIISNPLSRHLGPEKVFDGFSTLDQNKYPYIHYSMPFLFMLHKKWFKDHEPAHEYLAKTFEDNDFTDVRENALYFICKLMPYRSDTMINAINNGLEDNDPLIRGLARFYFESWMFKDTIVKNHQTTSIQTK